jgi:Flp pilus assembly protein TadG
VVVKRKAENHAAERGASLLVVMALGVALLGIAGLALDGGHLYVVKRRAQAAADAAAQAGVMDLYRGKGSGAATTSATAYAVKNGFAASETQVDYPACSGLEWCDGHVTLSGEDPNLIRVTITKSVPSTLLQVLGIHASTVKAVASSGITVEPQPVPILVLHPTLSGSFSKNGSNTIRVCSGPTRSIQVNSTSATSINIDGASGRIDLQHAGPADPGDCSAGTGADFANVGNQVPFPGSGDCVSGCTLERGTTGHYFARSSEIADPLLSVPAPTQPAAPLARVVASTVADQAAHNCPTSCTIISPGYYDGTTNRLDDLSGYVIMRPGIYWVSKRGFHLDSNTIVRMASAGGDMSDPVTATGWTNQVLIYNSPQSPVSSANDIFEITANSGKLPGNNTYPSVDCPSGGNCFRGSPVGSPYKGILLFQDRTTATSLNHSLSGGSGLTIEGTVYLTHTAASIVSDGTFQSFSLQGGAGGTTKVQGEIITDTLSLGGTSDITMNLSSAAVFPVRQVALVQ